MKEKVLQAMREAGKPVSAGDVTKALGADRKEVDKAFAELTKWETPSREYLPAPSLKTCPTPGAAPVASARRRSSYP